VARRIYIPDQRACKLSVLVVSMRWTEPVSRFSNGLSDNGTMLKYLQAGNESGRCVSESWRLGGNTRGSDGCVIAARVSCRLRSLGS